MHLEAIGRIGIERCQVSGIGALVSGIDHSAEFVGNSLRGDKAIVVTEDYGCNIVGGLTSGIELHHLLIGFVNLIDYLLTISDGGVDDHLTGTIVHQAEVVDTDPTFGAGLTCCGRHIYREGHTGR